MKNRIVLLGPPATGKGTQAALLSATFGIPSASTGAILREESRLGTDLGKEAARWTDHGSLFPDEVALKVVWSWIGDKTRFILDGFPRTVGQARAFDDGLGKRSLPLDAVYFLELSDEAIRQRMLSRLTCKACGSVFNETFHNVTLETPCPSCGGALHRRADDTIESLEQRLEQYRELTLPVAEHYRQSGLLHPVESHAGRDAVFSELYKDMKEAA